MYGMNGCTTTEQRLAKIIDTAVETAKEPPSFVIETIRGEGPPLNDWQALDLRLEAETYMIQACSSTNVKVRGQYLKKARECVINLRWACPSSRDIDVLDSRLAFLESQYIASN